MNIDNKTLIEYIEMKKIMGKNEILNHFINNFIQHIYFIDNKKRKKELFDILIKIKKDLILDKKQLISFLSNKPFNKVLDIFYKKYHNN